MEFRRERDSIGEKQVPSEAYYGVQSLRGHENFRISGQTINKQLIKNLSVVKKACAITNCSVGELKEEYKDAIVKACEEVYSGKFDNEFIIDPIQGGAGTSLNMNINEVISNRANEILGFNKGEYYPIHPNDHVNMGQSTNDVIPTAASLTAYELLNGCIEKLIKLSYEFNIKAEEFTDVIKMGRTEMQDAVPISLGSEFKAFSMAIGRDVRRLERVKDSLLEVNLGGTAVGTGITANEKYIDSVVLELSNIFDEHIIQSSNLVDGTQNLDKYAEVSSQLKVCAVNISKIAGDLILMSSGPRAGFGEIRLPARQNGSSIMPGKVNPVMPEVMKEISFQIMGNDLTITMATQSGQLELNAFYPIVIHNLYESLVILTNGVETFIENCVKGIEANEKRCNNLVDGSIGIVTALAPILGYEKSAAIAKKALKTGKYVKEVVLEECDINETEVSKILNTREMAKISINH
ncbi:MAG: aspartate ammonia-lyase [Clostridium sp.]|uniref:aspartate ammonia-lyase n=1 Tax=Clostridium sp. TaxID=1506 RepID=UPI00290BAE79|nr:aspartate ammonia-lyase [Clostridium sp.]MDU4937605.1 aspartate ammonia-lyase [Clostridium sp.]